MGDAAAPDKYTTINFEETELRLGLPGENGNVCELSVKSGGKRGFLETETVDLKLNLSNSNKLDSDSDSESIEEQIIDQKNVPPPSDDDLVKPPPAKAQVVGWPPVRSFRKNIQKNGPTDSKTAADAVGTAAFVKVSMDGAPYLRKVDLRLYKSYQQLSDALGKMFSSFTIDNCGPHGMKDFTNESKLIDLLSGSDYVPTYQDKDGDWMLVGDVPWEMFFNSCKRLRIMKGFEAIGLAPRAVDKYRNRS